MKWKYTYKDLMDMIEMLDAYDTLHKVAQDRIEASKKKGKS